MNKYCLNQLVYTILSQADRIHVYAYIGQLSVTSIPHGLISTQKWTLSCGYISTEITRNMHLLSFKKKF